MSKLFIISIEDNTGDTLALKVALDARGEDYELRTLHDGEEALRFVREYATGKYRSPLPCLILLDLRLPKYDGLEILKEISHTPSIAVHVRVLVVSSFITRIESAQIEALGATYRRKPVSLEGYHQLAADVIALCNSSLSAAVQKA